MSGPDIVANGIWRNDGQADLGLWCNSCDKSVADWEGKVPVDALVAADAAHNCQAASRTPAPHPNDAHDIGGPA